MTLEVAFEVARVGSEIKRIADVFTLAQHGSIDVLPGLSGYFIGGTRDGVGSVVGHGTLNALSQVGTCPTNYDANSFVSTGNGTNYLTTSSTFADISGLETWITSGLRGLTVAGWFRWVSDPTAAVGLISKDDDTPDRGYVLGLSNLNQPFFFMSGTGAAIVQAIAPAASVGAWHFLAGRFVPSTSVDVIVNGAKVSNTTAVPASINISAQQFEVGRYANDNTRIFDGDWRDVFVCASALTDEQLEVVRLATTAG